MDGKIVWEIHTAVPSKNLIRPEYETYTGIWDYYNTWQNYGKHMFIPITEQGTYYYTSYQADAYNGIQIALADADKKVIKATRSSNTSSSSTTKQVSVDTSEDPNAKYICICWYYDTFSWHQLLVNNSTQTYYPFEITNKMLYSYTPHTSKGSVTTSKTTGGFEIDYVPNFTTKIELCIRPSWASNNLSYNTSSSEGTVFSAGPQFACCHQTFNNYGNRAQETKFSVGHNTPTASGTLSNSCTVHSSVYGTFILDASTATLTLSGVSKVGTLGTVAPTKNLMIGGEINGAGGSFVFGPQQVNECKIWDNGELIRHIIPVMLNDSGRLCLFDQITKTYYYALKSDPTS